MGAGMKREAPSSEISTADQSTLGFWRQIWASWLLLSSRGYFWILICFCLIPLIEHLANKTSDPTRRTVSEQPPLWCHHFKNELQRRILCGELINGLDEWKPFKHRFLEGEVIVNPDQFTVQQWERLWQQLCQNEEVEVIYVNPGIKPEQKSISRSSIVHLQDTISELRALNQFSGRILPVIEYESFNGTLLLLAVYCFVLLVCFLSLGLAPLEDESMRLVPMTGESQLVLPMLFSSGVIVYSMIIYYQPYYNEAVYLSAVLFPSALLGLVLLIMRVWGQYDKRRAEGILVLSSVGILFLAMLFMKIYPAFYLEYLFHSVRISERLLGLTCLFLVFSIYPNLLQFYTTPKSIGKYPEDKTEHDHQTIQDSELGKLIHQFQREPTPKNRNQLLGIGKPSLTTILRPILYTIVVLGIFLLLKQIYSWMINSDKSVRISIGVIPAIVFINILFRLTEQGQKFLENLPLGTLVPVSRRSLRRVAFMGLIKIYIQLFAGFQVLLLLVICLGPYAQLKTFEFLGSSCLTLFALFLSIASMSLWEFYAKRMESIDSRITKFFCQFLWCGLMCFLIRFPENDMTFQTGGLIAGIIVMLISLIQLVLAWKKWFNMEWAMEAEKET